MALQRPAFYHMATTPNLVGFRSDSFPQLPPDKENAKAVLDSFNLRSNSEYRHVVFLRPQQPNENYRKHVSFDTVDVQCLEDDVLLDFSDEDGYDWYLPTRRLLVEADLRGRARDRDLTPLRSPGSSPAPSPTRMLSPIRGMDVAQLFQNQVKYPTTPIVTRRACTLTREHRQFDDLYMGKLPVIPVLPGRVILVYISGRQHTWVALDWVLRGFVEHGDSVIVVSAVPQRKNNPLARSRSRGRPKEIPPEKVTQAASNVMEYAMRVVDPRVIVRVTVEVCEGPTKDVLRDMYQLYEPNVVCTALKVNLRNGAPLKLWLLSRLSDRLVKNFPLPVVVVPALNMAQFEKEVAEEIDGGLMSVSALGNSELTFLEMSVSASRGEEKKESEEQKKDDNKDEKEKTDDSTSTIQTAEQSTSECQALTVGGPAGDAKSSISGMNPETHSERGANGSTHHADDVDSFSDHSMSSESSYDSFEEIADLYNHYRLRLHHELHRLTAKPRDEAYFASFLRAISDRSLQFCDDLRATDPDFRGDGAKLARAITGSNSFGAVPYKTKSLLMPETPKRPTHPSGAMSYSELKRTLKLNAMRSNEEVQGPTILVNPPSGETSPASAISPRQSTLRFSEQEKPSRRRQSLAPLKKYLSHEDRSEDRVKLAPSTSHPDIRTVMLADSDKKKKKKKRFWKLF